MKRRTVTPCARIFFGALLSISLCGIASAEDAFPSRPVTVVIPLPPGGSADPIMRLVAQKVSESIKQPVVIDNRPGAGGNIATNFVKRAAPDGYTLIMGNTSTHAINASLFENPGFDPIKDFVPITELVAMPLVLVVPADSPVKSMKDLVTFAKSKPGGLNNGTPGAGSGSHLIGEALKGMLGGALEEVHYRGTAQAMTDLLAGRLDMVFGTTVSAGGYLQEGRLRALAVTGSKRSPALPDVPTTAEAGFPGLEYELWYGMLAPAETPASVVKFLNQEFKKAMQSPQVVNMTTSQDANIVAGTPEQFADHIAADVARLGKMVRDANIKAN
jgi:tripartite-type tricarboxylate transporter receptor subunit TctC